MKNVSTRLLLSCAAIGVAGGILFAVNAWIGGTVNAVAPIFYGLTVGVYFVPGAVAQYLFHRGGVAIIATVVAGLVAAPFQPIGLWAALISVGIGLFQELPFLVTKYRRWNTWLFFAGAVFAGIVMAIGMYRVVAKGALDVAGSITLMGSYFIAPIIFTAIAVALGAALWRTGVARGLRGVQTRPVRSTV
jgi:energy-coupling factor transport system substrate-specific component